MLRAACIIRPLLATSPAPASSSPFAVHRFLGNSLRFQPSPSLWKPAAGTRCLMIDGNKTRTPTPSVEAAFKERDKIPPEYNIIYRAPLQYYIVTTYAAAWLSIVSVPAIIGSIFFWGDSQSFPYEIAGVPVFETTTEAYVMAAFLLMTVGNIAHTVSKYPFRMYRNAKEHKYIAVFQHFIPGLINKKEFVAGEVSPTKSLFFQNSCFTVKKKKMLIMPDHFSAPIELERMQIDPKLSDPVEIRKRRSKML